MKAVKIAMKEHSHNSNNPKDISKFYIEYETGTVEVYDTERLYDILFENSDMIIYVNESSSYLTPIRAANGQKYIRSLPNLSMIDVIMRLPHC